MNFFRRIDRWLIEAPASLVVLASMGVTLAIMIVMVSLIILLSDLRTTPRQIEVYIDPPKVKPLKE